MSDKKKKLWTAWCDYYATGEGVTLLGRISYARDELECRKAFAQSFSEFYHCDVGEGVVRNDITAQLFSAPMLDRLTSLDGRAMIEVEASVHFNMS